MAVPRTVLNDLPFCLARATIGFRRFCDHTLRAVGLAGQAPGMASVLHALEELDDCTVNALVERTQFPNGTLTGLLDALERDRFIRRIRNPDDGRSRIIQLTKQGRQICAKLHERHEQVMNFLGEEFSETESDTLARLLDRLSEHMRGFAAPPAATRAKRSQNKTRPGTPPRKKATAL